MKLKIVGGVVVNKLILLVFNLFIKRLVLFFVKSGWVIFFWYKIIYRCGKKKRLIYCFVMEN